MGQAVAAAAAADPALVVVARYDRPDAAGDGLVDVAQALDAADVAIDFSTPESSVALARASRRTALVIGATGFSDDQLRQIDEQGRRIAIVRSGNYSVGVNLLMGLVVQAARALPARYDIEIFEAHHRRKVDAPSGTALMLGEAAARGRGVDLAAVARRARDGITGARPEGEIGFAVARGGGIIGEHSVSFIADSEILTLSHSAIDRGLFADGACHAARWVAGRGPGTYDMQDVLGLKDG